MWATSAMATTTIGVLRRLWSPRTPRTTGLTGRTTRRWSFPPPSSCVHTRSTGRTRSIGPTTVIAMTVIGTTVIGTAVIATTVIARTGVTVIARPDTSTTNADQGTAATTPRDFKSAAFLLVH